MEPTTPLRVVTWNAHGLRNKADFVEAVRLMSPSVLIVQEALQWSNPLTWCQDLANRVGMSHAGGGVSSCGNLILTAIGIRVISSWDVRFPLRWGRSPRGAAFVYAETGSNEAKARFVAVGTHLDTDQATRALQTRQLFQDVLRAEERRAPAIVGLDVNETSAGESWRLLSAGRVDPAESTGQATTHTYSTSKPARRIDAIFGHPSFEVVKYEVVDTPITRRASDHFPVLADLRLPT